jgi:S1-C subfamily serine protease
LKNLQDATERICELKGGQVALDAFASSLVAALSAPDRLRLMASFEAHAEAAHTVMLHADISDVALAAFERDTKRLKALLQIEAKPRGATPPLEPCDPLLLTTTRVTTFSGDHLLTNASGFFFRRAGRLFLVSNRHVFADGASSHAPDRVEIELHTDPSDLTRYAVVSLPLHHAGSRQWREAVDSGGLVDVAALEIPAALLPAGVQLHAFDDSHLEAEEPAVAIGDALAIIGFPLGFHDTVHHLAVARSASVASAYGIRFQRQGCFLTDARTHRGSSGAPVVRRRLAQRPLSAAPRWQLIGVHSTRMDMRTRDRAQDESLDLNCAWYADVLLALTAEG